MIPTVSSIYLPSRMIVTNEFFFFWFEFHLVILERGDTVQGGQEEGSDFFGGKREVDSYLSLDGLCFGVPLLCWGSWVLPTWDIRVVGLCAWHGSWFSSSGSFWRILFLVVLVGFWIEWCGSSRTVKGAWVWVVRLRRPVEQQSTLPPKGGAGGAGRGAVPPEGWSPECSILGSALQPVALFLCWPSQLFLATYINFSQKDASYFVDTSKWKTTWLPFGLTGLL
jgi:hypothetical protein